MGALVRRVLCARQRAGTYSIPSARMRHTCMHAPIHECATRSAQPHVGYVRLMYRAIRRGPVSKVPPDGALQLALSVDCSVERPKLVALE